MLLPHVRPHTDTDCVETLSILETYGSAFKFFEADICDEAKMGKIFAEERVDVVCHLAAQAGVR